MQPPTRVNLTMDAVRLYNDVAAECAKRNSARSGLCGKASRAASKTGRHVWNVVNLSSGFHNSWAFCSWAVA